MSILPVGLAGGETGHVDWHNILHAFLNGGVKVADVKMDGTNQLAAINEAMDGCNSGDVLLFPRGGPITTNPFTVSKNLHILGGGRFNTWFVPFSNSTSPLITVDRTVDSGHGIYANYGPILEGFGINRQGHMAGPCLHVTSNAAHITYRDVLTSGGTKGLEHHAGNALMDGLHLWDASDCMLDMDENGLEVHMKYVAIAANVQNVNAYWRITISPGASGGLLGGIYIGDVSCRSDPAVTVGAGLVMSADSLTEIPTFCDTLVIDNVNGGGPVMDFDHIQSVSVRGWGNGTNGVARMDGCAGTEIEMRTRGGTHTYEWVGDKSTGFMSRSEVFTGPAYKISTVEANEPDEIDVVGDRIAGATDIGQVTNNAAWLERSAKRTWGEQRIMGSIRRRGTGAVPPTGFGFLVNGLLTVSHPLVTVNSRVKANRVTTGTTGLPGEIHTPVALNVPGVSFSIVSTSLTDSGGVYWEFEGDVE